jgi:hypothetical protein|tara:strand:- start:396 stop:635 length:240 start_codon:yes stop_codon:yes gene_type:complete
MGLGLMIWFVCLLFLIPSVNALIFYISGIASIFGWVIALGVSTNDDNSWNWLRIICVLYALFFVGLIIIGFLYKTVKGY